MDWVAITVSVALVTVLGFVASRRRHVNLAVTATLTSLPNIVQTGPGCDNTIETDYQGAAS